MLAVTKKNDVIHETILSKKIPLLEKLIQDKLYRLIDEFGAKLSDKQNLMEEREAARLKYDHYRAKVVDLRENKEKATKKGKKFDTERLDRNEGKLNDSTKLYNTINMDTIRILKEFWQERYDFLDALYAEWLKLESFFIQALVEDMSSLRPHVLKAVRATGNTRLLSPKSRTKIVNTIPTSTNDEKKQNLNPVGTHKPNKSITTISNPFDEDESDNTAFDSPSPSSATTVGPRPPSTPAPLSSVTEPAPFTAVDPFGEQPAPIMPVDPFADPSGGFGDQGGNDIFGSGTSSPSGVPPQAPQPNNDNAFGGSTNDPFASSAATANDPFGSNDAWNF